MKIFLTYALLLIVFGELAPCEGGQKESIPNVDLKWVIRPYPRVPYPWEYRKFNASTGIYGLDIDSRDGRVIRTYVIQRSISKILDDGALQTFMTLRFKSGCPPHVKIPVTWKGHR